MLYDKPLSEIEKYTKKLIPAIEQKISKTTDNCKKMELLEVYRKLLVKIAPYDFISFNKVLEFYEDKNNENKNFYYNRRHALGELFQALNEMEIYDKYDTLVVCMPPRVGKFLDNNTGVLTPTGWKPIGDMIVGDEIIGSDGLTYNVTGVFPQGEQDLYRVTFDDHTYVDAGLPHLWTVQTRADRLRNKQRTVTTEYMMNNLYVENGKRKNYSIKYVKPVEFKNTLSDDDIHPYVLGCILGDGCITQKRHFSFTNVDRDVIDRFQEVGNCILKSVSSKEHKIKSPDMWSKIESLGLNGTYSHTKFIPKKYLYSSVENRVELLRGLMDTDGCVNKNNHSYCEYSTTSEQLAKDVMELVQSLGGRATITSKMGSYVKDGVRKICKRVYRINMNLSEINPFYVKRKASNFTPRTVRDNKYITSIEYVGSNQATCIEVDSPDRLYIAEGYNLTHNTTSGIRFLAWIIGRYPEYTQMATSYSDAVTKSFYNGVFELVQSAEFNECFPKSPLVSQNAKLEQIWLKDIRRYPSILFVPIDGSMTGRGEAGKYMYCDDLVSGIEEALNIDRLNKLWEKYTVNVKQRKKQGCKEIHIATPWSVHDPITRIRELNGDDSRCKVIKLPCYGDDGESNFDYLGGFDTNYYKTIQETMDELSFRALYMQEPVERDGLLYREDELRRYINLPEGEPDSVLAVCDCKNLGDDSVACPIAYIYGDDVYIEDVVFNNGLPEITKPLIAQKLWDNKVKICDFEANNGGNHFASDVRTKLREKFKYDPTIRMFTTTTNKKVKIITYSDYVKKNFYFKDASCYEKNSEYSMFMREMMSYSQKGKNKHDDAADSLAMLAQMIEGFKLGKIKILDRRELRI